MTTLAPPVPHSSTPPSLHDLPTAMLLEITNFLLPGSVVRGLAAAGPIPLRHLGHTDSLANLDVALHRKKTHPNNAVRSLGLPPPSSSRLGRLRRVEVREYMGAPIPGSQIAASVDPFLVGLCIDAIILTLSQGGCESKLESLKLRQKRAKYQRSGAAPGPIESPLSRVLAAAPSMCPALRELELEGNISTRGLVENDQGAAWRCIFEQCPLLARLKLVRVRSLTDAGMAAIAEAGAKKGALRSLHVEACARISPAGWDHFAGAGLTELAVGFPFESRGADVDDEEAVLELVTVSPLGFLPRQCPDAESWEALGSAVAGASAHCEKLTLEVLPATEAHNRSWVKGYRAALDTLFDELDAPRLTTLVVGDGIIFDGGKEDIDVNGDTISWYTCRGDGVPEWGDRGIGYHPILFPSLLKWMRKARCSLQTLKLQGYQHGISDSCPSETVRGAFAHHAASLKSVTLQLPRQDAQEAGLEGEIEYQHRNWIRKNDMTISLPLDMFEAIFQPLAELQDVRCGVEGVPYKSAVRRRELMVGLGLWEKNCTSNLCSTSSLTCRSAPNGKLYTKGGALCKVCEGASHAGTTDWQCSKIDVLSLFCTKLRRVALTPICFDELLDNETMANTQPGDYTVSNQPRNFVERLNKCSVSLMNLVGRCHDLQELGMSALGNLGHRSRQPLDTTDWSGQQDAWIGIYCNDTELEEICCRGCGEIMYRYQIDSTDRGVKDNLDQGGTRTLQVDRAYIVSRQSVGYNHQDGEVTGFTGHPLGTRGLPESALCRCHSAPASEEKTQGNDVLIFDRGFDIVCHAKNTLLELLHGFGNGRGSETARKDICSSVGIGVKARAQWKTAARFSNYFSPQLPTAGTTVPHGLDLRVKRQLMDSLAARLKMRWKQRRDEKCDILENLIEQAESLRAEHQEFREEAWDAGSLFQAAASAHAAACLRVQTAREDVETASAQEFESCVDGFISSAKYGKSGCVSSGQELETASQHLIVQTKKVDLEIRKRRVCKVDLQNKETLLKAANNSWNKAADDLRAIVPRMVPAKRECSAAKIAPRQERVEIGGLKSNEVWTEAWWWRHLQGFVAVELPLALLGSSWERCACVMGVTLRRYYRMTAGTTDASTEAEGLTMWRRGGQGLYTKNLNWIVDSLAAVPQSMQCENGPLEDCRQTCAEWQKAAAEIRRCVKRGDTLVEINGTDTETLHGGPVEAGRRLELELGAVKYTVEPKDGERIPGLGYDELSFAVLAEYLEGRPQASLRVGDEVEFPAGTCVITAVEGGGALSEVRDAELDLRSKLHEHCASSDDSHVATLVFQRQPKGRMACGDVLFQDALVDSMEVTL